MSGTQHAEITDITPPQKNNQKPVESQIWHVVNNYNLVNVPL